MNERETRFGSGWISGVIGASLGVMGFAAVLCLHFPDILTTPELRAVYPMRLIRGLIHVSLIAAFVLGVTSLILRRNKTLGAIGVGFAMLAALAGGSGVEVSGAIESTRYIGLDFFLLDLFFLALVFVPVERLFPLLKEQKVFRAGWWTDLAYFFSSHLVVQVLTLLTMAPAAFFFRWALGSPWQRAIGAQPGWLQFLEILVVADLAEYWIHRLFHVVPFLWRFHAIHHSSTSMDWLAGSRLHLFDVVITRAFVFAPMYALGFAPQPLTVYLVFVAFHAVFLHANVRFRFGRLAWVFGTPRFHHWHHSAEIMDKNFAIHLPVIDWLFGTLFLPGDRWPKTYGIEGNPVPESFSKQLVYPLK
jgi:lathosterol oxidase